MTQLQHSRGGSTGGCPVTEIGAGYRPFDHAGMYTHFARARTEEPVFYCPEIDYYVVTKRQDCLEIFRDTKRFSAGIALSPVTPLPADVTDYLQKNGYGAEATQVSCDPPRHTRIRQFAGRLLSMKTYARLEPEIHRVVRHYADGLEGRDRVDLMADFAYELPARVVFLLLGIPDEDTPKIKQWADDRLLLTFGELDAQAQMRAAGQMLDYWNYCVALVEERMRAPGDDYASWLLDMRAGDDANLTVNEIASLVFGLLLAGHETTTNMTANALHALLTHRDAWRDLIDDPALIPGAVEESLRFASSVVCWRRKSLEPVEIGGLAIPEGANILLALGSANRDETHFADPDRFDIRRDNARDHLSFGHGIHFCVGGPLARIELRLILEELTRRFPNMRLAGQRDPEMIRTIAFRGPVELVVDLNG